MRFTLNPYRGKGLSADVEIADGSICIDPSFALELFKLCPAACATPLLEQPSLAGDLGVGAVWLKDERTRMGLGSFKALGAAFAIAKLAAEKYRSGLVQTYDRALDGATFVCASAGNHGLSMAAGARLFGADAVVYLSDKVSNEFAERLQKKGAKVVREGRDYEASMAAAKDAAVNNGWQLLSDSSWIGYSQPAHDVMQGYLIMGAEVADQLVQPPTHIFLQAGVGGLAAACTAAARHYWGESPKICVVEPEYAPALMNSILTGTPVSCPGPVSNMGRLDCKEPSHLALKYLAAEADFFMTLSEEEAKDSVEILKSHGIETSPSAAAGLGGLYFAGSARRQMAIDADARILAFISEGPEDE